MAEFCIDCWNKMNNSNYAENNFEVSDGLDLCEGCGEYKHVVICIKEKRSFLNRLFGIH